MATQKTVSGGDDVVLRTTGMVSKFSGEGFPDITSSGTRLTVEEAKKAEKLAKSSEVVLEEVPKP